MDAQILENEKENIKPFAFGRSASKLGEALTEQRTPSLLAKQREKLESKLKSEDSDDPLQAFVDYIAWTHNHYPQGANSESGLLPLLERCTSHFRDVMIYKNDPRYLKIWLEYAEYSNSPREIFVYLAKKSIAQELALYYEQFASFLESKSMIADAREVYEIGLERHAWPAKRLQRSMDHFLERTRDSNSSNPSSIRAQITAKQQPSASAVWNDNSHKSKRLKLSVLQDDVPATLRETVFTSNESARIAPVSQSIKENKVAPRPWAGEVLKQNDEDVNNRNKPAKFEVFRDDEQSSFDFELREENSQLFTIVNQPGKSREKICINMNLLYPQEDEELCLGEILAMGQIQNEDRSSAISSAEPKIKTPTKSGNNEMFTIPLCGDDTVPRLRSPTITMVSRMANSEVLGMFNDASLHSVSDEEAGKDLETFTDYDGFYTETVVVERQQCQSEAAGTPPTDQYDSDGGSSPFMEDPL